ncbi:hypothetical protein [Streptomyces tsukubensis]|nr:hypothetical protein [Streptomyces tsukubensis]
MPGAPLDPTDASELHGYTLRRRLGSGGMGVIDAGTAEGRPYLVTE